jgi:hypothetical protein
MSSALAIKAASPGVAIVKPDASSRLGPNKSRACAFVGLTLKEWVLAASGFGAAFFNRQVLGCVGRSVRIVRCRVS